MPPTLAPPVDPQSLPARLPEPYRSSMARPRLLLGGLPPHHTRRAVGRSLRLMLQAHRAIEATAALLGDAAWLDPSGERAWRRLHVRDPDDHRAIFLRPMLTLKVGGSVVFGQAISMRPEGAAPLVPIDAPEGWQPGEPHWDLPEEPVDLVPSGPDMHGGEFRITDGPAFYELRYRKDGVHFENTEHGGDHMAAFLFGATRPWQLDPAAEPPQVPPIRLLLRDDLDVHGWPTERLAQALAELADGNHTPARVLLPVDHPGGVVGCWQRVRRPLARWLWQQDPDWQGWVAVDGLVGTAVGQGRSRDEAEASCRAAIAATRPRRIEPEPYDPARIAAEMAARDAASERAVAHMRKLRAAARGERVVSLDDQHLDVATGTVKNRRGETVGLASGPMNVVLRGPESPIAWPEPSPENTPIVLLPVPPAAVAPAALTSAGYEGRHRVLGEDGAVGTVFYRAEPEGFVTVGAEIAASVRPLMIEMARELDRLDSAQRRDSLPVELAAVDLLLPVSTDRYVLGRADQGGLRKASGSSGTSFEPWQLGIDAQSQVVVSQGRPLADGEDPLDRHPLPDGG